MTAPTAPQPAPATTPAKRPWWQHPLLIGAVCLIVGFAAGAASRGGSSGAEAGATVTTTVTATPADPLAPSDGASNTGPVEGEPGSQQTSGTFQLGQPHPLKDGSTITISEPKPITLDGAAHVDGDADSYYSFTVTYANKAAEEFNPFNLSIQATSGTSKAPSVFDSKNGCELASTNVLPGKTLEWPVCFGAKKADGLTLSWSIMFTGDKGNVDVTLPA